VRSLKTKSRAEALRRFTTVSAQLQAKVEALRRDSDGHRSGRAKTKSTEDEARFWREQFARAETEGATDNVEAAFDATVEALLGNPVGVDQDPTGEPSPVYDPKRESKALELTGLVRGERTTVEFHLADYLRARQFKGRADYKPRQATALLAEWLRAQPEGNAVRAVRRRTATLFTDHLLATGSHPRTVKAKITALSGYWKWLEKREEVDFNPWREVELDARPGKPDTRGFTDHEVATLLGGPAEPYMIDLMHVGALTGMRLNEIGRLTVKDTEGGWIRVEASKTHAGVRLIPIHPGLTSVIAKRSEGKAPEAWLFDELPPSKSASRGRADKAGEAFTRYRRALNIDDRRGDGRSRITFHSFRAWLTTAAINAGAKHHLVSALVGRAEGRKGETLDTYYDGPTREALIEAIMAVSLPTPT
jgi:integrase